MIKIINIICLIPLLGLLSACDKDQRENSVALKPKAACVSQDWTQQEIQLMLDRAQQRFLNFQKQKMEFICNKENKETLLMASFSLSHAKKSIFPDSEMDARFVGLFDYLFDKTQCQFKSEKSIDFKKIQNCNY